ncbi:MAG: transglycosylase SLT domain-containing protein, partial [Enterobacteriaceae bacterium]
MKIKIIIFTILYVSFLLSNININSNFNNNDTLLNNYKYKEDLIKNNNFMNFMKSNFKIKVPYNLQIKKQTKKLLNQKKYITKTLIKYEPYMHWIIEQLILNNIPIEISLLPIIESNFDPNAQSNSKELGIWQLSPAIAKSYGLKDNDFYDGRKDIVASTYVAISFIKKLNYIFNGDWILTIAAYNSGENRVIKAIKKNKKLKKNTKNIWSLSLPQETIIYVSKILALRYIISNYSKFNIFLPKLDKNKILEKVKVNKKITLQILANKIDIPFDEIKK